MVIMLPGGSIHEGGAVPGRQIKSEIVMAGLYLGIAVVGVDAVVAMAAMGLVIAFM
jgi:hypothetical protein